MTRRCRTFSNRQVVKGTVHGNRVWVQSLSPHLPAEVKSQSPLNISEASERSPENNMKCLRAARLVRSTSPKVPRSQTDLKKILFSPFLKLNLDCSCWTKSAEPVWSEFMSSTGHQFGSPGDVNLSRRAARRHFMFSSSLCDPVSLWSSRNVLWTTRLHRT